MHSHNHNDPLQPHSHDPNPQPPSDDATIRLVSANGRSHLLTLSDLAALPVTAVSNCYIVSTGHGTSGPFTFAGPPLLSVINAYEESSWSEVEVVSGDGFGNRVQAAELHTPDPAGSIILAIRIDERPLSRAEGLVRLIVPNERDDALRQVKWVGEIRIRP